MMDMQVQSMPPQGYLPDPVVSNVVVHTADVPATPDLTASPPRHSQVSFATPYLDQV